MILNLPPRTGTKVVVQPSQAQTILRVAVSSMCRWIGGSRMLQSSHCSTGSVARLCVGDASLRKRRRAAKEFRFDPSIDPSNLTAARDYSLGRGNVRHVRTDWLAIGRIDPGRVACAAIMFPIRIASWLATFQGHFLPFAVAGDVGGLRWFVHSFVPFTGCCPLLVGHSVKAGTRFGSAGAFGSAAPSTCNEVMSGATA